MTSSDSAEVEHTLQKPAVHQQWEDAYRTPENEAFYELAFDEIASSLQPAPGKVILDVGCGSCAHSLRLARRGFNILAVDFSEPVLLAAAQNIEISGMARQVRVERQNILSLSHADHTFDGILGWGVMMHIPEIDTAISELDRVLKTGGFVVLAENNMDSFQASLRRAMYYLRRNRSAVLERTPAGLEWWTTTPSGKLLTRYADMGWLVGMFSQRGYNLCKRIPAQFSEFYVKAPSQALKRVIHHFNTFWFKYVRDPNLAFGNILIFQKR